jgi:DNA processing protein
VAFARQLAADLAQAGVAVLSGGAKGIDTEAHRGALSVGGTTAVIAPAGYLRPFPVENASLFSEITASGGAYASLVEDDVAATQAAFFARNACMAALSWALVVVQSGFRGGARNAAAHARKLGRPVFIVPSSPWIARGQGCIEELRLGGRICAGAKDVLQALSEIDARLIPPSSKRRGRSAAESGAGQALLFPGPHSPTETFEVGGSGAPVEERVSPLMESVAARAPSGPSADDDEGELRRRVTQAIASGVHEAGEVADLVGLPVAVVNRILLTLRLQGVLVSAAPGQLCLRKSLD